MVDRVPTHRAPTGSTEACAWNGAPESLPLARNGYRLRSAYDAGYEVLVKVNEQRAADERLF